jgi:6-pyruvoyltetrahydropterin/6-carboxytetrahydropterin synthase
MYRVTQEIDFCYGHRLLNYSGRCRSLHGHNGKAVVVMQGSQLDETGMLVDFSEIKRQLSTWVDGHLDHRMILCERDPLLPILRQMDEPVYAIPDNPTAENIARLIYDRAKEQGLPILEVALWETPRACAVYRGE